MDYDPHALADAENHLIQVLHTSSPPRDAGEFNVTAAAKDYHATAGTWDIDQADLDTVEELLARHAR
ncbi:hypothetical protein [Ornithinimicrobium cerasi]|uniref:hypothetical protein n=1 Tax=Ornithinimicrobium cerasi TaxID=2248773 RepID=UPI000EFF265C|nr:hypothetical protein [Ornithinimicrobium cerasi]